MYHTLAFQVSQTALTNNPMTAIQDDIIPRSVTSGAYILPDDMQMFAAYVSGVSLLRARLASATLRQINQPLIRPTNALLLPGNLPPLQTFLDQPPRIPANEEFNIEITDNAGAPTQLFCVLFLGQALQAIPPGNIITCRCTSTSTAGVRSWTTIAFTQDQTLPPGTYALVGSECYSTTGVAHRWIVPNQYYRPGSLSAAAVANLPNIFLTTRQLGLMGTFLNTVLPQCQVLCNAADASFEIYMQLIKIG